MLINEVEHKVGLSKKSIRFYEENQLIHPKRNGENGYRIYQEEDLKKLYIIKFLRELDVSIQDIKKLFQKEITLSECMSEEIRKIEQEENKYVNIKRMCEEIKNQSLTIDNIDVTKYSQNVLKLKKEGFTMKKIKSTKKEKIIGACFSSLVFGIPFLFVGTMFSYFQFTEADRMPWFLYYFMMAIFVIPMISIIINLYERIKEIKGEEVEEALGIVKGTIVQSKNLGRDFMAGMKTIVGGEISGYTEMITTARQIATKRMVDEANNLGADAILNIRYGSSNVMNGAAEVIAYGTAVKLKRK